MFPKAHEVSDDTSVCFWLISMVNVSTTNTLFEVKGTESPDVKTQSGLYGFFRELYGHKISSLQSELLYDSFSDFRFAAIVCFVCVCYV